MSEYNVVDNTELVELIERWNKALIPELKKRFKEIEKKEKLLKLYKKLSVIKNDLLLYCEAFDDDYNDFVYIETDLEQQIKELENEKED